jgi:hypothetical protein
MEEGGLGSEHLRLVEQFLSQLQMGYLRECDHLGWHASDKQIAVGLTKVANCADALCRAAQDKAVKDNLFTSHILSDKRPSTDFAECQNFLAKLDDDLAAIVRIRDLARAALERHNSEAKTTPNRAKISTAEQPELASIVRQTMKFWTEKLRRKESGDDGRDLRRFCRAALEHITEKDRDESTIRKLLSKDRKLCDAKPQISGTGPEEK